MLGRDGFFLVSLIASIDFFSLSFPEFPELELVVSLVFVVFEMFLAFFDLLYADEGFLFSL